MTELASDWGFQPFGETAEYPAWDLTHGDDAGKRAQKTDKRRQRQLEALVSGVVRLTPAPAGGKAKSYASADSRQTSGERRSEAPSQAAAAAVRADLEPTAALGWVDESVQPQQPGQKRQRRKKDGTPHDGGSAAVEDSRRADAAEPDADAAAQPQQAPAKKRRNRNKFKPDADAVAPIPPVPAQPAAPPGAPGNAAEQPAPRRLSKKKRRAQQAAAAGGAAQPPGDDASAEACAAPLTSAEAEAPAQPSSKKRRKCEAAERPEAGTQQSGAQREPAAAAVAAAAAMPESSAPPQLSKSQKRKRQRQRQVQMQEQAHPQQMRLPPAADAAQEGPTQHQPAAAVQASSTAESAGGGSKQPALQQQEAAAAATQPAARPAGNSKLLDKMRGKLQGGRFRWLNEQLYTSTGDDAFRLMQAQPDLYSQYHEGFRRQAADWPQQPVNAAIAWLKGKPKDWVVADFGCGDAQVAAKAAQQVHSFDLVADSPGVTACNMADVPLPDASVDAAIFCLALMGTDYGAFLQEAHRVLKPGGWLWVCEVRSRFAGQGPSAKQQPSGGTGGEDAKAGSKAGGKGGSLDAGEWVMLAFTRCMKRLGFKVAGTRVMNKMFVVVELRKGKAPPAATEDLAWPALKGSVYKKQ